MPPEVRESYIRFGICRGSGLGTEMASELEGRRSSRRIEVQGGQPMTDQDQKKPDFSNVVSGSGDSGSKGGGSADFSNVVSGSSSTAPSSAGSAAAGGERFYVVA